MRHATLAASAVTTFFLAGPAVAQVGPPAGPGFPNVPRTPGTLLSGLNAPGQGRTAILAYHNGVLFTVPEAPASLDGSDFQVRTWDISNPAAPVETAQLGITPMPIGAHGYLKSGDYLVIGPNWPPAAPWSFRATAPGPGNLQRTTWPPLRGIGARGDLFQPWYVGDTFWSYNPVDGDGVIARRGVELARWDHLGLTGVIGHPFLLGDLLIFAADQSRTGVATYDVSDPTNPVLLDVLTSGGPGGYWPELWGGDGKLYLVFPYRENGNGFRVVDVTDPTDLRLVTDRPLPGAEAMYVQFQDEHAFLGSHKVDMRTFESVLFLDGANAVRPNDGGIGVDTSQFLLPLGNLLVTGGIGEHQGMAIWAHQAEPDTRGPSVGYHVPQAGRTGYPVGAPISLLIHETLETPTIVNGTTFIVRPLGGGPIPGQIVFSFDDVLTFTPDAPLLPDTTYEVVLPAGGIEDAAGNGMVGYSFTFSTGAAVAGNHAPAVASLTAGPHPADPGETVSFAAVAGDPDGDPVELRFDFGDGTPKTAWSPSAAAAHAYAEPGHYRATVQARDPAGSLASSTRTVTVVTSPAGPFGTHSSPIVCDAAARRVWSVNPDQDTVAAVDADSLAALLEVPACADPRSLARTSAGELWVACHDDDRLVVLDGATGALLASLDTGYGSAPVGVAASPDGATVYVALTGAGALRRYDAASRAPTGSVALGPTPRAIAVTGDGARVYVTRFLSPRDHAEVWEVDAASLALSRTLRLHKLGGEHHRDGTAEGRGAPNYLAGITVAPDGETAWVAATKPDVDRGLLFGPDLDQDNTVRTIVAELDLDPATPAAEVVVRSVDVDDSDSTTALAFSPWGDYLFVTLQGNDELVVLDALALDRSAGLGSLVSRLPAGRAPQGVCVDPPTERTFVHAFLSRAVTALETGELYASGAPNVDATEVATVAAEALAPQVLHGKRLFYGAGDPRMSGQGYLSCATCHVDGGHDGRTWDFTGRGEGLRNTTTLHGRAGTGQGNVHWSANFDEIQDFENDVRGSFGGTGFLDDDDFAATAAPLGPVKAGLSADLDALAAYVASLGRETLPRSPHRAADGSLTPQGLAGRAVFAAEGCASCHGGPGFTDSTVPVATLHDVGTLRTTSGGRLGGPLPGIDTPSLLGVWATAPYLHDGSAETLADVFRVAGGEVIPAESAAVTAPAWLVDQWVELNNDDTVHGRAFVYLGGDEARLTFNGVDGGPGGPGAVEMRYSNGRVQPLEVRVNGVATTVTPPSVGNAPEWWHSVWRAFRVDDVALTPGPTNTIEIAYVAGDPWPNVSLDEIVVATAADLAAAEPHRRVQDLPAADRDALLAYLLQLDGTPEPNGGGGLFADGFESGDAAAWAASVP